MKQMSEKRRRRIEKILYRDRRGKVIIYNRIFLTGLAVLLQIAVAALLLVKIFYSNSQTAKLLLLLTNLVGFFLLLHIVNNNDKLSNKLGWIVIILLLPVFGILMFFLYGDGRPTKKMNLKVNAEKQKNYAVLPASQSISGVPPMLSALSASQFLRMPWSKKGKKIKNGRGKGKTNGEKAGVSATTPLESPKTEEIETENSVPCGITKYLSDFAGFPAAYDGEATYFSSGKETFEAIMEAVRGAKKFILAEYFIIAPGKTWSEFLTALVQKAEEGVQVRLIFDNAGCLKALPPKYDRYVESLHKNIKCLTFNPIAPIFTVRINNRDHRKQIVIDGKVAFTGGINLSDEYVGEIIRFGNWKDSGLRVRGSAANTFTMNFFNVWNAFRKDKDDIKDFYDFTAPIPGEPLPQEKALARAKGAKDGERAFLQPYDDSPLDKESVGETVYLDVINRARRYVWIYTPYLILDDEMRAALCTAAKRGTDVRIVAPGIPDKKLTYRLTRANFLPLMKSGVKIYTYTPGFVHAKSMLTDDRFAVIGTINLDYRSLYLNFENAVYFSDCAVADDLKADYLSTFPQCKRVEYSDLRRGYIGRFFDSLLRVFETLF